MILGFIYLLFFVLRQSWVMVRGDGKGTEGNVTRKETNTQWWRRRRRSRKECKRRRYDINACGRLRNIQVERSVIGVGRHYDEHFSSLRPPLHHDKLYVMEGVGRGVSQKVLNIRLSLPLTESSGRFTFAASNIRVIKRRKSSGRSEYGRRTRRTRMGKEMGCRERI